MVDERLVPFLDQVFNEDIFTLLARIPDKTVDMVWSEPDYNVGWSYGEDRDKVYTRPWDEYIEWYIRLARESIRVLKDDGNAFFLNYDRQNAYLWVKYLDSVCYEVVNYIWVYNSTMSHPKGKFPRAHRSILHARKTAQSRFYKDQVLIDSSSRSASSPKLTTPLSWIYANIVVGSSREKTFHSCQIPMRLSRLFLEACTKPGDVVLIHFCGSGSEVANAHHLKRHFITTDLDPSYVKLVRERVAKGYLPDQYRQRRWKNEFIFPSDKEQAPPLCSKCRQPLPPDSSTDLCDDCSKSFMIEVYKDI